MTYKRQVAYLDYFEFGEKKGSGGFCKWEQKNGIHTMEISLNASKQKLPPKIKIYTRTESELGEIRTDHGRAVVVFSKSGKGENWDWEFSRIKMVLGEDREFVAEFSITNEERPLGVTENNKRSMAYQKTEELKMQPDTITDLREKEETERLREPKELDKTDGIAESETLSEPKEEEGRAEPEESEKLVKAEESVEIPQSEEAEDLEEAQEPQLHSLWDLLVKTRRHIKPFGTDVEYYRILLEDISLLKQKYHILRNNPFLLHGYYNYKYLILGKKEEESEEYWLGVPGIYHEREKMAARMYGFEKFEGKKPEYRIGDIGYYLITVE